MSTIEQQTYIGNVIYTDPTARKAMANVQRYYSYMKRQERRELRRSQETTQPEPVSASKSDPINTTSSPTISSEVTCKQDLNDLSHVLAWLKNRRKLGEITRQDFTQQHKPLATAYNSLLLKHMEYVQERR